MLPRKVVSASISGVLFAILLGFFLRNSAEPLYFYSVSTMIWVYVMYSFPVILIYGVVTSIISDKAGQYFLKKSGSRKLEFVVSGILHIGFGLVFLPYSLGAAILFFVTDRLLQRRETTFQSVQAVKSLLIPLAIWFVSWGILWTQHLISVN
ncbi:hypothetical protein V1498_20780 [Peribacillus sp. SCS-26]|uniref:hypothetical protein n=1 Tax=Paraperibacillus marinus TaxID=3115295 RepID=UPI003905FA7D